MQMCSILHVYHILNYTSNSLHLMCKCGMKWMLLHVKAEETFRISSDFNIFQINIMGLSFYIINQS